MVWFKQGSSCLSLELGAVIGLQNLVKQNNVSNCAVMFLSPQKYLILYKRGALQDTEAIVHTFDYILSLYLPPVISPDYIGSSMFKNKTIC